MPETATTGPRSRSLARLGIVLMILPGVAACHGPEPSPREATAAAPESGVQTTAFAVG